MISNGQAWLIQKIFESALHFESTWNGRFEFKLNLEATQDSLFSQANNLW